jgi:hypothetical protein
MEKEDDMTLQDWIVAGIAVGATALSIWLVVVVGVALIAR